jgi:hypothetical protein
VNGKQRSLEAIIPYQFKKGETGNKIGANAHSPEIKAIKKMTMKEIEEIGTMLLNENVEQLKIIMMDKDSPAIRTMIAAVVLKAISRGDAKAMNTILDRIVGKIKQHVEISDNRSLHSQVVDILNTAEKRESEVTNGKESCETSEENVCRQENYEEKIIELGSNND